MRRVFGEQCQAIFKSGYANMTRISRGDEKRRTVLSHPQQGGEVQLICAQKVRCTSKFNTNQFLFNDLIEMTKIEF